MINKLATAALAAGFACTLQAGTFSNLVAFGDSLTDNGNAYIYTKGAFPGGNYAQTTYNGVTVQYYTDGPNTTPSTGAGPTGLWIDQFASKLGVADPAPFLAGGPNNTNFAAGGAQTGANGVSYVGDQVATYLKSNAGAASGTALYTFWAGSDDILNGSKNPGQAADNIESYIEALAARGAKNFLWLDVPPLGSTPLGSSNAALLNAASAAYNSEWASDITALKGMGINVYGVDVFGLFDKAISDNQNGCVVGSSDPYCFANVTTPAQGVAGADPNEYLFWDNLHPTTAADTLVADAALAAITATPEPANIGLMALALAAGTLVFVRQRRKIGV